MVIFTAQEKREAVEREIKFRQRVFPRLIENGKMTRQLADQQIAIFKAIRDDYANAEQGERLI